MCVSPRERPRACLKTFRVVYFNQINMETMHMKPRKVEASLSESMKLFL